MTLFPRFLFARKPFFLLAFYIMLSFVVMGANDASVLRGLRLVMLQAVGVVSQVQHVFQMWKNYARENRALKRENFYLKLANQQLREVLLENARLRRLLHFKQQNPFRFVAAHVIGSGMESSIRSIILDAGQEDSVKINNPVLNADGLVGKIVQVAPHQSIAQILLDHNSLVSARLQFSRVVGVIAWTGHAWLDLQYIPNNVSVKVGELVVTSGLSRIYPAGLKIGVVKAVRENKYEFFKEIHVQPAVNFSALEEVFILTSQPTRTSTEALSGE